VQALYVYVQIGITTDTWTDLKRRSFSFLTMHFVVHERLHLVASCCCYCAIICRKVEKIFERYWIILPKSWSAISSPIKEVISNLH